MEQFNTSKVIEKIEDLFKALNADFFDNKLELPTITVSQSADIASRYLPETIVIANHKVLRKREITITSSVLSLPLEQVCAHLIHNMCHMYNDIVLRVKDTSRQGTYHNKKFRHSALRHGLIVAKDDKYGYSLTSPNEDLVKWCKKSELYNIELYRYAPFCSGNSHSRKYECPKCKNSVRATKEVNIICADCNNVMVFVR